MFFFIFAVKYLISNSREITMQESRFTKNTDSVINFDYLDDEQIQKKLIEFTDKKVSLVTFYLKNMRCASCIGSLEKLYKVNPGIISSKVEFLQKRICIFFDNSKITLKQIAEILSSTGYEPVINIAENSESEKIKADEHKKLITKIGVAGFCLGNIMLLSFPEYLSGADTPDENLKTLFNCLNIILALPVFFYCSSDYFISAFTSLKKKIISIDLPVSIGLTALFVRSLYEIIFFNNAGFIDSLAGLVFLLLLGKLFQSKTFESLNYERDYKSYFPVSVIVKSLNSENSIPLNKLQSGDRIIIRNKEIIPADSILFSGNSIIDYSFVTGESAPVQKFTGEIIYAGGRHSGSVIELEVIRPVTQSYLTQLWNNDAFKKKSRSNLSEITNLASKYFTFAVLLIAFISAFYWLPKNADTALNAFTTVLIVACPCALALTTPFALGNAVRIFGRNKFYLKNAFVVENLSNADTVVFDKTGTITSANHTSINFTGNTLSHEELALIKSSVKNSTHPLCKKIYDSINEDVYPDTEEFSETVSEGIKCKVNGNIVKLGTVRFLLNEIDCSFNSIRHEIKRDIFSTNVFLSINDNIKGYFSIGNKYRSGLSDVINEFNGYTVSLISGDNNSEKSNLKKFFSDDRNLFFNQKPSEKLNFIKSLQDEGKKVIMVGDGLNDAGALKQSDAGISVTEDISNFSPSCDAILESSEFSKLGKFIKFSKSTITVIKISFAISFLYNVIGLYLASQGIFSPLVAAILMPFNSISIILFVVGATNFIAKRRNLL